MADGNVNETGFSSVQLRAISDIIASTFAQERAQNQIPPSSSNQPSSPLVVEREAPEPISGNQASAELYNEEKKKSRGFGNYRSSYGDQNRSASNAATNQSGSSNTVGAVNEKERREFTDLVIRSCIKNGVLSKLPIDLSRLIQGRFVDRGCEYHQCKGHSTDDCFKLRHDIQDLIDSAKITKPPKRSKPMPRNH
ncbi:hypothetical protein JCGZ_24249 [Jatropha curcas]|uniref:Gag-pol polyprotein n=1 Tax=Jatropha curcas TaxID=180498 RepID=A0A067K039_JATCU|nr:hypothetical protein JCGZ_24249 [Jatropha curcas]